MSPTSATLAQLIYFKAVLYVLLLGKTTASNIETEHNCPQEAHKKVPISFSMRRL
jgi:hypothetical protein